MPDVFQDCRKPANFSTTIKLEGIQLDIRTNGPHESMDAVVAHTHAGYEVQTALSGKYFLDFGSHRLQVSAPDTLCLIPPECPHRICQTETGTWLVSLRFACRKKPGLGEPAALADAMEQLPGGPVLLTGVPELCTALRFFSQELVMPELASQQLLDALLQQFSIHLLRGVKKLNDAHSSRTEVRSEPGIRNDRYSQIEAFFQENYTKRITEHDLARVLNVSKRQTSRILREQCGKSFHEKLEEARMDHAQRYLQQRDSTVEDIAFRVGYSSASGFFVAFKKRFGMTPTQYRRAERGC